MTTYYNRYWPWITIGTWGDSITAQGGAANWQLYLWQKLRDHTKFNYQFVGTDNGPLPIYHDGVPSQRIDQLEALLPTRLPNTQPQKLIFHGGTNDILQGATGLTTVQRLQSFMTALYALRPDIQLIVCKIIPLSLAGAGVTQGMIDELEDFNSRIDAMVAANFTGVKWVSVADCFTGFDPDTMLSDGIHQNALGAQFMGEVGMLSAGTGPIVDAYYRTNYFQG